MRNSKIFNFAVFLSNFIKYVSNKHKYYSFKHQVKVKTCHSFCLFFCCIVEVQKEGSVNGREKIY